MTSPFVHLDVRSFFSLKEGAFSPEDLARRAARLGMPAVAITDRDGLYGAARFVAACEREDVRPLLGATLTVREERLGHPAHPVDTDAIVIARDATGYANLCRLITDAHMVGERGDPSLAPEQVCAHPVGLVFLLGASSLPGSLAVAGSLDAARTAAVPFREAFGDRLHICVQYRLEQSSGAEVRALLRLAEAIDARAVATNPVRYLVPEDAFLADALECMREIVPLASHHVTRRNAEGYLKAAREMRSLFRERPDLCDATLRIAESCSFDVGLKQPHFPEFPTRGGRSASSVLAERCWRGLAERGMKATRKVRERLDLELAMIHKLGYSAYFLTVADIVADVKAMGIRCACRGSAAGSLVCHLTGISDVDPVRHDLAFERFLNPLRDELPDIDVDVESARREDVYDMVLSRYGDDRAACVAMVDTYRARAAIREVGKTLGIPEVELGVIAKSFPHIGAHRVREAIERLPELAGSNLNVGQLEIMFRVVERLDGFPRHIALHPSGIVLSRDDLVTRVPLERSFQGYRMIQADKDDVELLGYLKLDVLGVRMLSSMRHALDEIARTEAVKVDLGEIPLDDPPTFELIRSSDTLGCFQIESPGQRELLQKLQPERWEDLIVDISLFRPGPVKSDMITPYLRRRAGMERPTYAHASLRSALRETFGVIVYHEQVMRTLAAIGGYDLSQADQIRRNLDDQRRLPAMRRGFLARGAERGVDPEVAGKVWDAVAQFASFGFCKAHAAAFAVPTYQSAWLKAHYPAHFLAGVLTHDPGMYPRRLVLDDARRRGIEILPLDVNRSEKEYTVETLGAAGPAGQDPANVTYGIRLALQEVEGISGAEIRSILEARADRPFRDVGDFLRRTNVARPVAEAIAHAGGFDVLPAGSRRDRLFVAMTAKAERAGEQLELALDGSTSVVTGGPAPSRVGWSLPEYTEAEKVRAELEVLGLDASRHLMSFYEPLLDELGVVRAKDLWRHRGDEWVMVTGVKVASQTPAVRSGQRIIFLSLDDGTGVTEVTVFERVQPKVARTVFHSYALAVWGRLRRTGVRGVSIIAEDVWDLVALHRARRDGELERALAGHGTGSLPPRKLWHASGGSAGW
ncbi:MAG TPA: DNA polymerase III subunit alpha [Actinomycetota bacterium]|nr:DNA polymerase III subunit alpha [Actinomycetota bacterium]